MQLHFKSVSELGFPSEKWRKLFFSHWDTYNVWLQTTENPYDVDLKTAQVALQTYMPELWSTYIHLCHLVNANEVMAKFLTGYQPPTYASACSNAVVTGKHIQLVRNYDYHPHLIEGTQLLSSWNGKKVIATSDCLSGALDGMNEDGLAVSLTFGGRQAVGIGFGIPTILRYILEFCSNVDEAVAALLRIPSHISFNVTVVDRKGQFKTVYIAPDKKPVVTNAAFTTNHQEVIEWPENATFNKTNERSVFLDKLLAKAGTNATHIINAFFHEPLYSNKYNEGFGTLYTAVYKPTEGIVDMHWPHVKISQSFHEFHEQTKIIHFNQHAEISSAYTSKEKDIHSQIQEPIQNTIGIAK